MLDLLGREYRWAEVDILAGESRTPAFLALNPAGQVPTLVLEDGRALAQSNAILVHLGEGGPWIPTDGWERARMFEWLFWEQYSHEPYVAVARFQRTYLGWSEDRIEARLMARGHAALARMEAALAGNDWLAGGAGPTLADLALVAYTRLAHEGGFDLAAYPAVRDWIDRTEAAFRIS